MTRLFISLYFGLIVTILAFFIVAHLINTYLIIDIENILGAENFTAEVALLNELDRHIPPLERQQWIDKLAEHNQIIIEPIKFADVPQAIQLELGKKTVWFDDEESNYFRAFTPSQYFRIYQDESSELLQIDEVVGDVIFLTLGGSVALCCFIWLFGLHHKLKFLERTLNRLAKGDLTARAPLKSNIQVGKLNTGLNEMAEKMEHLLTSHKRLTHTVAHELRSPLFRMQVQLELLEHAKEKERVKYIEGMEEDIFSLQDLVDELLDYAKLERAELTLSRQTIHIREFAKEIFDKLSLECTSQIKLVNDDNNDMTISADKLLLQRCLTNLLRNAEKYGNNLIHFSIHQQANYLKFSIEDNGEGIASDQRENVFKPFYRAEDNKRITGYGLGLAIVKEIVLLHGGCVTLGESTLGGARFSVLLPVDGGHAAVD